MFNKFMSQGQRFFLRSTILCFNVTGSLICKMKQFVQNKSQAKKLLEDQITYKCSGNVQGLKKQTNKQTNKQNNECIPTY